MFNQPQPNGTPWMHAFQLRTSWRPRVFRPLTFATWALWKAYSASRDIMSEFKGRGKVE